LGLLKERNLTLGVAESITGGVLQGFLTEVPGSSAVFRGGVVAYHADLKQQLLGVPAELIEQHTVVSPEVAAAMAEGVRRLTGADYAIATTGEAGPESASGAPVGTVYLALAGPEGTKTEKREYFGSRDAKRRRASLTALDWLRRELLEQKVPTFTP
jgi:PncC family amidohydrolase